MPFAVAIDNRTPFAAGSFLQLDADGQENLLTVMSASFCPSDIGELAVAEDQLPVVFSDQPYRDGAFSSLKFEADIAMSKPKVEVIVNGTAYAPGGKPVQEMLVGLRIGSIQKVLRVVGDRSITMGNISAPDPFVRMNIVYERAFGGAKPDGSAYVKNPVGVGFQNALSSDSSVRSQTPNIYYPTDDIERMRSDAEPAGFGVIGRGWQPRLKYAGTYDQQWIDAQWPLPPKDFDPQYNMAAPSDQQTQKFAANDQVSIVGMTKSGRLDFRLPEIIAPVHLVYEDRVELVKFVPDTVIIEPDYPRVTLKSRVCTRIERMRPSLVAVIFGHTTPAYVLARRRRKAYLPLGTVDRHLDDRALWRH